MQWLNYHHLLYFWIAAKERSVTKAAKRLGLAQPTVSEQIRQLEEALGARLFERTGRDLRLSDTGRVVVEYADEIFSLGQQMLDVVSGARAPEGLRLVVGLVDVLPKLVVYRLLEPALRLGGELVCREDRLDRLVAELSVHSLDVVLADSPLPAGTGMRGFNHLLGQSGVTFFAAPELARRLSADFPQSLEGAPFLFPGAETSIRRSLDAWLAEHELTPKSVGQFDDPALANTFGGAGKGVFIAPSLIATQLEKQHGVRAFADTDEVSQRFYVLSRERRIKHPGVAAISQNARKLLDT